MGIQRTKQQLVEILADSDNRVVAFKGRWGTGKTHLFREIMAASTDPKLSGALTVSLFGLRSMSQIKLKLMQSALPSANKNADEWRLATQGFSAVKKVLVGVNGGFSAIDELALLAVPKILRGKVIVLDDIERKHPDLSIDEVLGFIDEFTQEYQARFVLVLNSDQLQDQELWTNLTEKVVDQEVRLNTTPSEAFEIAARKTPTNFAPTIEKAVVTCGITNIRVIRKVIKTVNRVLRDRHDLPIAVLERAVPSAVLLAATHYRGIEDGPTTEYILATGNRYTLDDDDETVVGKKKSHAQWDLLLSELGILACDQYDVLVVDLLKSGLADAVGLSAVIDRYIDEQALLEARQQAQQFLKILNWDYRQTNEGLLESAKSLAAIASRLDAATISAVAEQVSKLGGEHVAEGLIDAWLAAAPADFEADPDYEPVFKPRLHPRIDELLSRNAARAQASITVLDACKRIIEKSSWGTREELTMRAATPSDFESVIYSIDDVQTFQLFMRKMLDLTRHKAQYERHFGSAMDNFVEACRRIVASSSSYRLATIITAVFSGAELRELLTTEGQERGRQERGQVHL